MTISGRYEGFYAYIEANYKNRKLKFNTSAPENSFTLAPAPYCILEIGAALDILVNQKKPEGFDYEKVN